jgi:predicted secreted protein
MVYLGTYLYNLSPLTARWEAEIGELALSSLASCPGVHRTSREIIREALLQNKVEGDHWLLRT